MKSTKKSLLLSTISLILCFAMLLGTTYAWFTDEVTSGTNIIKAGNLDVEMYYADGTKAVPTEVNSGEEIDLSKWNDASEAVIFNYELWEPGYTDVKHVKIANVGNLALKYQLSIVPTGNVSALANVIDVYSIAPTTETTDLQHMAAQIASRADMSSMTKLGTLSDIFANNGKIDIKGNLMAEEYNTLTIALKMQEEAGNEYRNLAIGSGFKLVLNATQYTKEADSFGNQYDKDAVYTDVTAATPAELTSAIDSAQDGDVIGIGGNDLELTGILSVNKNVTIVGDGEHAIEKYPTYVGAENAVTFKNVKFDDTTFSDTSSSVYGKGFKGTLIFDGCTFGLNHWESAQITPAGDCTIVFNNCTFNGYVGAKRFIHIQPAQNNTLKLNVTITNCTFNNCDLVNYNTSEINKGSVIDLDYFAQGSTITMGGNAFNLSSSVTEYPLHPYFCDAAGQNEITGGTLLTYLTGDVHTYSVTASGLTA